MIPLVDLKAQYLSIKEEIDIAIKDTVDNSVFIKGKKVEQFEDEFARFCDAKYSVGCSNGTSAIYAALKALDISTSDEVIIPSHTFIGTAEPVILAGAKIVFADIDSNTYSVSPSSIKKLITDKTKAIIPVHLYGNPAPMDEIMEIAVDHDLKIIEDCAQAHGAEFKGKKVGTFGDIGCFSFYPGKNIGAFGDAGAVVTNSKRLAEKMSSFVDHGRIPGEKYLHDMEGFNFRIDTLQAAILSVKLKHLHGWNEKRRAHAKMYNDLLSGLVVLPKETPNAKSVYHLFVVQVPNRDPLLKYLNDNGIGAGIHYPVPLHLQPVFRNHPSKNLGVTEAVSKKIISLPMFPELSGADIELVCDVLKNGLKR